MNQTNNILRFPDAEQRSRKPDAVPRDPADASVVFMPLVPKPTYDGPYPTAHELFFYNPGTMP